MRGIYVIICWVNHVVYVGQSVDIYKRWERHRCDLNNGINNIYLQRSWDKYGEAAFEHRILVELPDAGDYELLAAERDCIRILEPVFNINKDPTMPPTRDLAVRAKMAASLKGNQNARGQRTPEQRARMSAAHRGFRVSEETKVKISASMKGHKITWGAKISKAMRGRKLSPEHIEKMRMANIGKKRSDETRAKMSASHKAKGISIEQRVKMNAGIKKHARQKMEVKT